MVVSYRAFRNDDPPALVTLWNSQTTGRGSGKFAGCDNLEQLVFAKSYFDRRGLIVATEGERLIGFCLAGFGANESFDQLDRTHGVICALVVDREFRRRGVATELLRLASRYVAERGAKSLFAGSLYPLNPFGLGFYGGSESPGVLDSDTDVVAFLKARGFAPAEECVVLQIRLQAPPSSTDPRAPLLRREVEILAEPWPMLETWWHGCTYEWLATLRYEMLNRQSRDLIASAWAWKMETFERVQGAPMFGLTNFFVTTERRRNGYATLLLQGILRHLYEEGVSLIEVQTMSDNVAAQGLYQKFGFREIDRGRAYEQTNFDPEAILASESGLADETPKAHPARVELEVRKLDETLH